ncbi:Glycine cleavage system transcriptional activator [Photobacterium marinum]|uniref:Glycine cleavage system transcriptional activator n=1 Tax=Photobacterium marinum TaxID=1056511 RepID=L8JAB7_9GAMM|nr:LysR family transcriptional regulator [Photobacterium marinum]ELR65790.1 Glycine cleavage system transcriptional activator [Photobacterium marinum]
MKYRHSLLPSSLNGLRVFEAAARHLSFTQAATELNVTQSAVSRQIRQLEDHLGFPLFIRQHRSLTLTGEGKEIALLLTRQYSDLNGMIRQLKTKENAPLRVKVAMSFGVRWLIPRLHSFKEQYPSLDIVLTSVLGFEDTALRLDDDDYDVAIYGLHRDPKSQYHKNMLRKEYLAPVYSELLTKTDKAISVDELLTYPRLHPTPDRSDWREWLKRNHKSELMNNSGLTFDTLDMALTSCFAGQGVTITDLMLVVHELKQGYLKLPRSATIIDSPWQYYYHCQLESDAVTNFITWLTEQLETEQAEMFEMAKQQGWQIIENQN